MNDDWVPIIGWRKLGSVQDTAEAASTTAPHGGGGGEEDCDSLAIMTHEWTVGSRLGSTDLRAGERGGAGRDCGLLPDKDLRGGKRRREEEEEAEKKERHTASPQVRLRLIPWRLQGGTRTRCQGRDVIQSQRQCRSQNNCVTKLNKPNTSSS